MKLLPLLVAAAVILLTGATICVGARVREETVVAHPYEEGLAYDRERKALAPTGGGHDHAHATPPTTAGAPASPCDLGAGPCTVFLGGAELTLELGPRPLAALRALSVEARLREASAPGAPVDGAELTVAFAMPGMEMGMNEIRLAPAGGGRYRGEAVLVRCLSGRRDWRATVRLRRGGQDAQVALPVKLGE